MRPGVPDAHISDAEDREFAAYRPLSGRAVAGLIFGLLAPLALIDPLLWAIPAIGAILSGSALRRIKASAPALTGGKMAIAGLMLSLLFAAAAPTDLIVHRQMICSEARQLSSLWFRLLTHDEPEKAFQLTVAAPLRQPLDDRLWSFYRNDARQRANLEAYVNSPLVRTLLALGPKAQVRFYDTVLQTALEGGVEQVIQLYAVTYEEEGEKKSFFVDVSMIKKTLRTGPSDWHIETATGGVRPAGW